MTFWFSNFDNYNNIPNDYLCVSISSKAPITFNKKNAVVPFDGIFTPPISLIENNVEENLDVYQENYDIVLTGDDATFTKAIEIINLKN